MPKVEYIVDQRNIEYFKQAAELRHMKASYRNRGGKQYITIKSNIEDFRTSRLIVGDLFDEAGIDYPFHTSGGMGEHTYRINPDKPYREHIDKMRNRNLS